MANERNTEILTRKLLGELGYYTDENTRVEEQRSVNNRIANLLKGASKTGGSGNGSPEFIITSKEEQDFLILFECKASTKHHESENHQFPKDYSVDGALHYAKFLSKEYNVIAVAISGETLSELKISNFIWPKGASTYKDLVNRQQEVITNVLNFDDYVTFGSFDPAIQRLRHDELMSFSRELHNFMRDHAKLTEAEKPLLVSGTLIALRNKAFAKSYLDETPHDLQKRWFSTISDEIFKADIPNSKKENMVQPYSSLAIHPVLGKSTDKFPRGILSELITLLKDKVWPFISIYHDFDIVGQFYGEFLKYTGGDKKALGIVLTPRHVTELFALIANVNKDSRVYDPCCGTGGFLISAMQQMMHSAQSKEDENKIKQQGLYGIEQQPSMYALAASNMILRGDGKANLYQGSCFDHAIEQDVISHRPTVGMINPPYAQKDEESRELVFVREMLKVLDKGAIGVAIVPIGCAISANPLKEELLKHHTLEAVMSMPDELFYPVGTVTCIMVFKAHIPHETTNQKTWFGYWKNDGFMKTKHLGRVDMHHTWPSIRDRWVTAFRNRDDVAGESVKQYVTGTDEWCAEAYMETDYSSLDIHNFRTSLLQYLAFLVSAGKIKEVMDLLQKSNDSRFDFNTSSWEYFRLSDLFEIKKGKRLTKQNMTVGSTPYVGSSDANNGLTALIGQSPIHKRNTISVCYNGSVAEAFYQPEDYWATDDVNVLYPKFQMDAFRGLFIATIIKQEKYRYNYGRKWHLGRMNESLIKLPATYDHKIDLSYIDRLMLSLPTENTPEDSIIELN